MMESIVKDSPAYSLRRALLVLILMVGMGCSAAPKHEMRGMWVATVYGIDWPSTSGASAAAAAAQKRELIGLMDVAKNSGMNAILLQVRPMGDAFYKSSLEPWSSYLTGGRGTAPAAGWDPLAFAVKEAHARGLELHAWVNPFRLSTSTNVPNTSADRRAVEKGWVLSHRTAKKGVHILDPGNAEARQHIVEVCREIISKYDVDGLVFDDYFYPEKFPIPEDEDAEEVSDLRRANVNQAIKQVYAMIQKEKPWVRFGVAPAGVAGGNGRASSRHGLPTPSVGNDWMYDDIFCDPLQWLADGSVDYISPQVYWPMDHATNPFEPLAVWWSKVASHFGRHLFISQNVPSLPAGEGQWREQCEEVKVGRVAAARHGIPPGQIFYSAAHITGKKSKGLGAALVAGEYATPSLMPVMTWKKAPAMEKVRSLARHDNSLTWFDRGSGRYVVYAIPDDLSPIDALATNGVNFDAQYILGVTYTNRFELPLRVLRGHWFAVAPYDRYGNEGDATTLNAPAF